MLLCGVLGECLFLYSHNTDWDIILARRNRCVAVTPGAPPPPPPPPRRPSTTPAASHAPNDVIPSTGTDVSLPGRTDPSFSAAEVNEKDPPRPQEYTKPGLHFNSAALQAAIGGLKPVDASDPKPQDSAATPGAKSVRTTCRSN